MERARGRDRSRCGRLWSLLPDLEGRKASSQAAGPGSRDGTRWLNCSLWGPLEKLDAPPQDKPISNGIMIY